MPSQAVKNAEDGGKCSLFVFLLVKSNKKHCKNEALPERVTNTAPELHRASLASGGVVN